MGLSQPKGKARLIPRVYVLIGYRNAATTSGSCTGCLRQKMAVQKIQLSLVLLSFATVHANEPPHVYRLGTIAAGSHRLRDTWKETEKDMIRTGGSMAKKYDDAAEIYGWIVTEAGRADSCNILPNRLTSSNKSVIISLSLANVGSTSR